MQQLGLLIKLDGLPVVVLLLPRLRLAHGSVEEAIGEFEINGRQLVAPAGRKQPRRFALVDFARLLIVALANEDLRTTEPGAGRPSAFRKVRFQPAEGLDRLIVELQLRLRTPRR